MMDHAALKTLILADPVLAGWAHTAVTPVVTGAVARADDQRIADALNASTLLGQRPVPLRDLSAHLFASGAMESIQMAALGGNLSAALMDRMVSKAIEHGLTHADPAFAGKMDVLAAAGAMSAAQAAAARALFDSLVSPAEQALGLGTTVSAADVSIALRGAA